MEVWYYVDELAQALASLYPEEGSLRRFAGVCGVAYQRVSGESASDRWVSLLREAEAQGVVGKIVEVALREYPINVPLARAVRALGLTTPWGNSIEHEVAVLQSDVKKIEHAVEVMWKRLNPPVRRRVGELISRVVLYAVLVSFVIPVVFQWYVEHLVVAAVLLATVGGIAWLARWLPE